MLLLILLWIAWCALHSLLIINPIRFWFGRRGGPLLALYRIGYVLLSILTLVPVLWYMQSLPQTQLFSYHGYWRIPQAVLLGYALLLFYLGTRVYDTSFFLGIRQLMDYRVGREPVKLPFRTDGILRFIRHPWYSGALALLWGLNPVTDVTLVSKCILTAYLIIGTLLEERKLRQELGHQYASYCREVPMLLPWKGRSRPGSR